MPAESLAYLYRQLRYASRVGIRQIAGYLPLFEAVLNLFTLMMGRLFYMNLM